MQKYKWQKWKHPYNVIQCPLHKDRKSLREESLRETLKIFVVLLTGKHLFAVQQVSFDVCNIEEI